jgi:hypothetical protein
VMLPARFSLSHPRENTKSLLLFGRRGGEDITS